MVARGGDHIPRRLEQRQLAQDDHDLRLERDAGAEVQMVACEHDQVEAWRRADNPVELAQRVMDVGGEKDTHDTRRSRVRRGRLGVGIEPMAAYRFPNRPPEGRRRRGRVPRNLNDVRGCSRWTAVHLVDRQASPSGNSPGAVLVRTGSREFPPTLVSHPEWRWSSPERRVGLAPILGPQPRPGSTPPAGPPSVLGAHPNVVVRREPARRAHPRIHTRRLS
jgi:hypothetical protein